MQYQAAAQWPKLILPVSVLVEALSENVAESLPEPMLC